MEKSGTEQSFGSQYCYPGSGSGYRNGWTMTGVPGLTGGIGEQGG